MTGTRPPKQEIERKYLLRGTPTIPPGAEVWRIEQGYLAEAPRDHAELSDGLLYGRLRRTIKPDGSIVCTHTIKQGIGMVRTEMEREIPQDVFERHWPRTEGRRVRKTRFRVREGEAVWEIDVFSDIELALAEIELPHVETPIAIPAWLEPCIVRDVTNEAAYTNSSIAGRVGNHG
jgi:adenylate cyclase